MEWMNSNLNDKPREVKQKQKLLKAMKAFEKHYRNSVEEIAPLVNKLAESVPRRRERMLHTGFFGYARSVGKNSLPRAIAFTCALYSIGVPPELIGVGRAIREIKDLECVEENYVNFREDLLEAGKWLNKNNLERLSESGNGGRGWKQISEDVKAIEEYLGEKLGPASYKEEMHANAASNALLSIGKERIKEDITKAAELRGFLG
jgi:phosphoenolpyruvate carboxylase